MPRKLPRGKGYDKAATLSHLKKMVRGGSFVTEYAKQNDLKLDLFILAVLRHGPDDAPLYLAQDPKLIEQRCEECDDPYWPSRRGTKFCSPSCGRTAKTDETYFNKRRKDTVGLAEGVCQLCTRHVDKGLSSHHIFGKANDPENEHLLALCRGCHAIVSELALKKWCTDQEKLSKLILLACLQRDGAYWVGKNSQLGVSVMFTLDPPSAS